MQIQKEFPTISKTTVYRNLRQLANKKLIYQVALLDGLERYDTRTDQHYHFQCRNCGSVFDIDIERLTGIDEAVQRKYGFHVHEHELVFNGFCDKCSSIPSK